MNSVAREIARGILLTVPPCDKGDELASPPLPLTPCGRLGHHGVLDPVLHRVPAAAASSTGSEAGVARHRNTVEYSIRLRCDRACSVDQLGLFRLPRATPLANPRAPTAARELLASPIWADTLLAVNGAPLTPAVPPRGGRVRRRHQACASRPSRVEQCGCLSGGNQLLAHAKAEVCRDRPRSRPGRSAAASSSWRSSSPGPNRRSGIG